MMAVRTASLKKTCLSKMSKCCLIKKLKLEKSLPKLISETPWYRLFQKSMSGGNFPGCLCHMFNILIWSKKWAFLARTSLNAASGPSLSILSETIFRTVLYRLVPGFNEPSLSSIAMICAIAWNRFIGNLTGSLVRMVFQTIELVMMSIVFTKRGV